MGTHDVQRHVLEPLPRFDIWEDDSNPVLWQPAASLSWITYHNEVVWGH
jgi:hypothetical protein